MGSITLYILVGTQHSQLPRLLHHDGLYSQTVRQNNLYSLGLLGQVFCHSHEKSK